VHHEHHVIFLRKRHQGNIFENPNRCNSSLFEILSKCVKKFANKIMELLYVKKVPG
jgi:hypothetical protein